MRMSEEDVKEIQESFRREDESFEEYFKQADDLKAALDSTTQEDAAVLKETPSYGTPEAQVVLAKVVDEYDEYDISKKAVLARKIIHPIDAIERSSQYVLQPVEDTVEELEEDMEEDISEMQKRLDRIAQAEKDIEEEEVSGRGEYEDVEDPHPIEAIERGSNYDICEVKH